MKYLAIFMLLMTSLPSYGEAQLDAQQKIAKNKGIALYNQYKAISAISFLTIAAEAGDPEAQYYLGEALRTKNHYMNAIAIKWYEVSANQNNLYAMIQLGRIEQDLCNISSDCPLRKKHLQSG
jgi:TPR repeat protein